MVTDEHGIIVERIVGDRNTYMTLLQLAVSGILSKEGNKAFKKAIDKISLETLAHEPENENNGAEG